MLLGLRGGSRSIIRVVGCCTGALHVMILVLWWHTDETRLELLLHTVGCTHAAHLRSSVHSRSSHELPCHLWWHAGAEAHRHVAIFSRGCRIDAIHLLLRLHHLLHLHHILLLEYDCHPRVGCLAQLCQFGHFTSIGKLLDIILCGQFWGLCTPLIVLDQLLKLNENQKKSVSTTNFNQRMQTYFYWQKSYLHELQSARSPPLDS